MHGRIITLGILCLPLFGCSDTSVSTPAEHEEQEKALGRSFDRATAGSIRGRVVWDGDIPKAEETVVRAIAFNPNLWRNPATIRTPHIPQISVPTRAVENAVVFLRGIDPERSRPWDHPMARVEFHERKLLVQQDNIRSGVGFVRRNAAVEVVNRDAEYHNLRARGAAFFGMPLAEAARVHERTLTQNGIVDLTCAAGYYWLHAHLFVVDHPYYTRTDVAGQFNLEQVPPGNYEIICWLPNWHVTRMEADPETGITARLIWADPKEQVQRVTVGDAGEITFRWTAAKFGER